MAEGEEPLLDAADIQGNIIPGFGRQQQYLVAFGSSDGKALRRALAMLRPYVTTLGTALGHRDDRKQAFLAGERRPERGDLWLNLALGPDATDALGAAKVRTLDESFSKGMRSGVTGDPTAALLADGTPNLSLRDNWAVGSRSKPVDLLLIFAHDWNVAVEAEPLVEAVAALLGVPPVYREAGALLPGGIEHFGFRDGISQVGVRGRVVQGGAERLLTTRYGVPPRDGIDFGKPGQPLVWPGQFLTGQPNFSGDTPGLAPELTNGSFLVFRRLRQDVALFLEDTEKMARDLGAAGVSTSAEELRSRLVGRYRSGAALMRHESDPGAVEGPEAINYFAFANELPALRLSDQTEVPGSPADLDVLRGRRCPIWAHIRKVNPRDTASDQSDALRTLSFQMLRRSIPFGSLYNPAEPEAPENAEERGLLFLSYQRSIIKQFDKLNRAWMNSPDGPSPGGFDLLVGQNVPDETRLHAPKPATFFKPIAAGDESGTPFAVPNQWVLPTGGAFLFAPSLNFLDRYSVPLVA